MVKFKSTKESYFYMHIKKLIKQSCDVSTVLLACWYCLKDWELITTTIDMEYYENVLPKMYCLYCGKDRNGNFVTTKEIK